jgi:hypothetical protein
MRRGSQATERSSLDGLDSYALDSSALAGSFLIMISIRVEKHYGDVTVYSRVTAESIERALQIAGEGARVIFPIEAEEFFAFAKANVSTNENPRWHIA